ncbi:hypothetical protein [Streptomyces mirabilis]|uniref:hypothetical protein n=1 Tax=Streptomyces mirabilis TaxID=68239 RepID=UPI0036B3F247
MSPNQKTAFALVLCFTTSGMLGALSALAFAGLAKNPTALAVAATGGSVFATFLLGSAPWVALFKFSDDRQQNQPLPPVSGQAPPASNQPGAHAS